jgi:hypothetical protein
VVGEIFHDDQVGGVARERHPVVVGWADATGEDATMEVKAEDALE